MTPFDRLLVAAIVIPGAAVAAAWALSTSFLGLLAGAVVAGGFALAQVARRAP